MGAIATPLKKLRSSPNWTKDRRFRSTEPLSLSQQLKEKEKRVFNFSETGKDLCFYLGEGKKYNNKLLVNIQLK